MIHYYVELALWMTGLYLAGCLAGGWRAASSNGGGAA